MDPGFHQRGSPCGLAGWLRRAITKPAVWLEDAVFLLPAAAGSPTASWTSRCSHLPSEAGGRCAGPELRPLQAGSGFSGICQGGPPFPASPGNGCVLPSFTDHSARLMPSRRRRTCTPAKGFTAKHVWPTMGRTKSRPVAAAAGG